MKKIIYFSIFVFFTHFIHAQKHDNIWILGNNTSALSNQGGSIIDFTLGEPSVTSMVLPINMKNANFTYSSFDGNLLFYSNGIKIINSNHELMENGDSLNAGLIAFSNINSGYPFPQIFNLSFQNSLNKTYLIHMRRESSNTIFDSYLYSTEIDLTANNGLGKVIQKNQLIYGGEEFYLDFLTVTKHANGRDWWIITPNYYESKYHTILLTPDGFTQEFIQNVGSKPDTAIIKDTGGVNVFSPDGNIYIDSDAVNGLRIFDFDRCTGELTHRENIAATSFVFSSVSPNSKYLYSSDANHIIQYDLSANSILSSLDTVATYDDFMFPSFLAGFTSSQLASDGKIYSAAGGFDYLHIIHQPNKKGTACQVEQFGIELPYFNHTSLPHYPNYRLGPIDGSPCDSLGIDNHPLAGFNCFVLDSLQQEVEFVDNSHYEPTDWYWTFGDGNTSTEMSPVHTYAESGIYEVCLVVSNVNSSDTLCKLVEFMTNGVEEVLAQEYGKIKIIPNPSSGEFSIQFLEAEQIQDLQLVVYNSLGQSVFEKILNESYTHDIHLPRLDAGIYFCEFLSKGELIQQEKLVIVNP